MKTLIVLLVSMLSVSAFAVPALSPTCAGKVKIKAPKNGSGVYFDRDCTIAYVLPPVAGSIALEAVAGSMMLGECRTLDNFMKVFQVRSDRLLKLAKNQSKSSGKKNGGSVLFPAPSEPSNPVDDTEISEEIKKLRAEYIEAIEDLKEIWVIPGATAQFTYTVGHETLVEEYRKLNPQMTFKAIPIREAKIKLARTVGAGESKLVLPMVLESALPGVVLAGDDNQDNGVVGGEGQSSQVTFSLAGACPFYNSSTEQMASKISAKQLSAHAVANLTYMYELQSLKKYTAKYNLGAFVRRVQSSESKGGFFSTKTINKLIVDEKTTDWFEITTYTEDGRDVYDAGFAQMIKAQMIDRALKNISVLINGDPVEAPAMTQPPANGASAASKELRKCPHLYCQVGAGVLDVANAIFGKSKSVAEYIHNHDTWVTETESSYNMFPFLGTVPFTQNGG